MNASIDFSEGNTTTREIILIVPCYNEETRWPNSYWHQICSIPNLVICFVNDGSADQTSSKILPLLEGSDHVLLELKKNTGKAEAIRRGLNKMLEKENPAGIGFLDADGAFPVSDVKKQLAIFLEFAAKDADPPAVWSSRVQLAGRAIERDLLRHYLARILMTLLAIRLKFKVYDTQSGFKIFPYSQTLRECLIDPFETRWFIDLEIFLRWRQLFGADMNIWEEPLLGWQDIGESKLTGRQYFAVLLDIFRLDGYLRGK